PSAKAGVPSWTTPFLTTTCWDEVGGASGMAPVASGMRWTATVRVRSGPPTRMATVTGMGAGTADAGSVHCGLAGDVQLWWRPSRTSQEPPPRAAANALRNGTE